MDLRSAMPGLNNANQKRLNLRPQLESGESRKTGNQHGEAWLNKSWLELLDAHYECDVPGPAVRLLRDSSAILVYHITYMFFFPESL